jgi:hypothetical protein
MSKSLKLLAAGSALLVGITRAACAQTPSTARYQPPATQTVAAPSAYTAPADQAVTLPGVTVVAPQPYAPGNGEQAGSGNHEQPYHFQPWPGYAGDPATHPYASGLAQHISSGNRIPASHVRVWPGYDSDAAMHPYTSGVGQCPEGGNGSGCELQHGQLIKASRYERPPFTD